MTGRRSTSDPQPPRMPEALLRRLLPHDDRAPILGDLAEEFLARCGAQGHHAARRWYWWHVVRSLLPALRRRRRRPAGPVVSASLDALRHDAHASIRYVARRRWRSAAVVGLLSLAIGLATTMFTLVDALVLRTAPFEHADQVAMVHMRGESGGPELTPGIVFDAWRNADVFAAVEGVRHLDALVQTDAGTVTRAVARITPGFLELVGGVVPVRGRLFGPSDGVPGSDDRVLISEDTWRTLYGADPAILGRQILVDREPVTIVGVLPADFRFPEWDTTVWWAAQFETSEDSTLAYVRFSPDVPRDNALRVATEVATSTYAPNPGYAERWATARPIAGTLGGQYERAMPLLTGGVVFLFLILCANVSSLLLSGFTARRLEFGTRAALGASRGRLVRRAFFESAWYGAAGVIGAIGIGWALVALARANLPAAAVWHSLNPLDLDTRALVVSSAVGLAATLIAGILPAIIGTRVDPGRALQLGGRSGTESPGARLAMRALLVGQIAVSCTLLIGAAVLVRSFVNLATAERGVNTKNTLYANVSLRDPSLGSPEARADAVRLLKGAAETLPEVSAAAWSYGKPPGGGATRIGTWVASDPGAVAAQFVAHQFIVDPDFFALYEIPVIGGRVFSPSDTNLDVIVSERFARALWHDRSPVGRRFTYQGDEVPDGAVEFSVVGVAGEVRYPSLDADKDVPQFYVQQRPGGSVLFLNVRCRADCPRPEILHERLIQAHPGVRVQEVGRVDGRYLAEMAMPRLVATLAFVFAATALVAASAGLFSLLSQSVGRRRREFGIRSALGATSSGLGWLVWKDGLTVAVLGLAIGGAAGLLLSRALASLLYETSAYDPLSWTIVAGVLAATVAAASVLPAHTAGRASPVMLLREE